MSDRIDLYPVALIEDRYGGTYSGGRWLAVANADTIDRMEEVWAGPHGDDGDASSFWGPPPEWIAVGNTPAEALATLYARRPA